MDAYFTVLRQSAAPLLLGVVALTTACTSLEAIAAKDFERASQTVRLCSKHMAGSVPESSSGSASDEPTSLLDIEHDLRARMRVLLGDPRPALAQVERDLQTDLAALLADLPAPRPATPEAALERYRARLKELLGQEPPDACVADPSACPWGPEPKDVDENLSRLRLALRTLRLQATIASSFQQAASVATFLGHGARLPTTSADKRWEGYRKTQKGLLQKVAECAKPAPDEAKECRSSLDELVRLEELARGELRELESAAKRARVAFVTPESAHRLDALVGRYRRHVLFLTEGAAAARTLRDGKAADFLDLMTQREGRLVARFAFRGLRASLTDLNHRIDRLDDKLYGALTIGSMFGGDAANDLMEVGVARVGKAGATLLKRLRIAPEPVLQEACNALLQETSPDRGLLRMDAVYAGIVKGLGEESTPSMTSAQGGKAAARTAVAPKASTTDTTFEIGVFHAAAVTAWSTELSHQIAHGGEAAPPPRPSSEDALTAFFEELLRRPDLLRAALTPPPPDPAPTPTDRLVTLAPLDVRIAGEVTASVRVRVETRTSASIDTTGLARQIEAMGKAHEPLLKSNADVIDAIGRAQGTFLDAQTVNAMCAVLHDNPMLRARRVDSRCLDRTPGNAVGALELGGRKPAYGKAFGLFDAGSFRLVKPSTNEAGQRIDELNEALGYVGRTLDRIAQERRQMRFSVRVEGFASATPFTCSQLVDAAAGVLERCTSTAPTCFGPDGRLRIDGQDVRWPTGEDACAPAPQPGASSGAPAQTSTATPKPRDGNPALALLRAFTVADKLRKVLCASGDACSARAPGSRRWQVDPEIALVVGRGDESNQTVRIYVQQRRE